MQEIVCDIEKCGYRSNNGFCLNRLVKINSQGVCNYLTKEGWDVVIGKEFLSTFNPWTREPDP